MLKKTLRPVFELVISVVIVVTILLCGYAYTEFDAVAQYVDSQINSLQGSGEDRVVTVPYGMDATVKDGTLGSIQHYFKLSCSSDGLKVLEVGGLADAQSMIRRIDKNKIAIKDIATVICPLPPTK